MLLSRRRLLSAATGVALVGLSRLAQAGDLSPDGYLNEVAGYGPLKPDPARLFDLPDGFAYTVVSRAGDPMDDGLVTPRKMDGMGCFALDGERVALVRNHELSPRDIEFSAFGEGHALAGKVDATRVYDRNQDGRFLPGGTTTLIYDVGRKRLESSYLSLAGTSTNCAGGITPWGSWLSCEEVLRGPGPHADGHDVGKLHGWVFETPSGHRGLAAPTPITGMGRFKHEAVAIDPRTGIAYLTEDEVDGRCLFYRYLPDDRRALVKGGRLQALGFRDGGDSRNWTGTDWAADQWRETTWIDLDGVENPGADLRHRGHAKGAAWFARGEGIVFGDGELYFTCTSGGPGRLGQVLRYRPSRFEGDPREATEPGRLQLFLQPTDPRVMKMCDNLVIAPNGHLVICEDKTLADGANYLRGVTPEGKVYAMGRLVVAEGVPATELAGACFSPDGTTLFVNSYWPGFTLAITGPWDRFRG
ncbi:alkaline phosphatase PhoX [uncultured Phenylobacterium sp.]|uniref:alkaline phosphatase PhoX n=1 Tax=uncultured Phenylobacterium sp. TaxID=349273 RepID=UPI0025D95CD9|nr:alkaline phosphatase PhoX [uncultured Phenylobacterium sp.]